MSQDKCSLGHRTHWAGQQEWKRLQALLELQPHNVHLTFTITTALLSKMAWVYCADLCLQSSWLVKHSWERSREPWLCLHEQVNSRCCWGGWQGLWLVSSYPLLLMTTPLLGRPELPPAPAHPASLLCPTPALLIVPPQTSNSPFGCLHHPVVPLTLCPLRCDHLGTGWEKATLRGEPVTFSDHPGWLLQERLLRCSAFPSAAQD